MDADRSIRRCVSGAVVWLAVGASTASGQPAASRPDRLELWLDAVRQHEPGSEDVHFDTVASWSINEVHALWTEIELLLELMRGRNRVRFSFGAGDSAIWVGPGKASSRIALLACAAAGRITEADCLKGRVPIEVGANLLLLSEAVHAARRRGDGDNYILRRGALLHADLAMLAPPAVEPVGRIALPRQRYRVNIIDGQRTEFARLPVHWQLARMLLDHVQPARAKRPAPGQDAMVRLWYRATATWMQWHADYEAAHLEQAREVFPSDPDILFLSACIHETYAGNRIQNALQALVMPQGVNNGLGSPREELRKAESFLRRAVEARPGFTEAHLHLGRVLALLDRPGDAVTHLTTAIGATDDQLLLYYGHLFLGGAYEALRKDPESRAAYEHAASLFPTAQAPHLGLSQLARRRGEREAALTAMQTVFKIGESADTKDDPWWHYYTSQGRGADDLLVELRRPFLADGSQ